MTPQDDAQQGQAQQQDGGLVIPDEVREQHGELLGFIQQSESMNDEERQYWINILPIMTPDQIKNLRTILLNEKRQLAAIDKKYSQEVEQIGQQKLLHEIANRRKSRRKDRQEAEQAFEEKDQEQTEDILKQIEGL